MSHLPIIKNQKKEARLFRQRLFAIALILAILVGILLERLIYLQVVKHQRYSTLSHHNHVTLLPIEPKRGLIFDRNGILLASNTPVYSLDIIRDQVPNLNKTVKNLASLIKISPDEIKEFYDTASATKPFQPETLKINLSEKEIAKFYLNKFRFPGVLVNTHLLRNYPLANATAHVLGYVGRINVRELRHIDQANYSASNFIGKVGIEKHYEALLHGQVGYQQVEVNASGRIVRVLKKIPPISGQNIYLTIDSKLQQVAEKALGKENGSVVAIDPSNGEILTLVSTPTYNPNLFVQGIDSKTFSKLQDSPNKPLYNRAIRGLFPFGSTIKPFIALGALDSKIITPSFTIFDPGWFKLPHSSHVFRDWLWFINKSGHGTVNVTKAIIVSCDTFFYNLAPMMGIKAIDNVLEKFGFGQKTNIDMDEELPGIVASPAWKLAHTGYKWYPGDSVISIIGQGSMSTTPIELANATAVLSNRGIGFQVHLLLKRIDEHGVTTPTAPIMVKELTLQNPHNWNTVIKAMEGVINAPNGTGRVHFGVNVKYSVAGKTGTAQLYSHHQETEYETERDISKIPKRLRNDSLFIAFAPVKKPQIAIAVIAENSTIAGSVARKVLDYYLIKEGNLNGST